LAGTPSVYAALDKVPDPRPWSLPRLPDAHAKSAAKPLVYVPNLISHIGVIEVFCPPLQEIAQGGLALLVAHAVTSRSNLFELAAKLGLTLLMQTQAAFAFAYIEAIAKELQPAYVGALGLLAVDL
jgi:hypothetical protein